MTYAQTDVVFRVGTLNQVYERSTPSVGTFVLFYGSENTTLNSVKAPDGSDLFQGNFRPSSTDFLGLSPLAPQRGYYTASYTLNNTTFEATASFDFDKDAVLPVVENVTVGYLDGKLNVTWKGVSTAKSYDVLVSRAGETEHMGGVFNLPATQKDTVFEVSLTPGNYLVVIRAYNFIADDTYLPDAISISETSLVFTKQ